MAVTNASVVRFSPSGLVDSLDLTETDPGGMAQLQNLIPDPTTKNLWGCRPAAVALTTGGALSPDFNSDFNTDFAATSGGAGPIVTIKVVGDRVFGMRSSITYPGFDEPFCFNLLTKVFVAFTGIVAANLPVTQPTTGDWVPPTLDVIGVNLVVTHPGFDGITNFFGWFNISNPAAITWQTGNTTTTPLTSVPSWVAQFGQRAYFGLNPTTGQPSVMFTDVLLLRVTSVSQALTFGDNVKLTAAKGLPLNNQLGGVVQSLLVFKGSSNIYQITGDAALTTLTLNTLNSATGTLSPSSICATPRGVAFLAPDGYRLIDFSARVSDPLGVSGAGVVFPFLSNLYPSRVNAACNANVMRVTVQPSNVNGTPFQEYWYDVSRNVWSGPHTLPSRDIDAWNNTFVLAPRSAPTQLFTSDVVPTPTSGSVELGVQMQFIFQTGIWADPEQMALYEVADLTVNMALVSTQVGINIAVIDENGSPFNTALYSVTGASTIWGTAVWGAPTVWRGGANNLRPRRAVFSAPIVYRRMAVYVSGPCAQGFQIGDIFLRRRVLDYIQVVN